MFRARAFMSVVALAAAIAAPTLAAAQSTCALPVAAYLTDAADAPLEGTVDLELRFYVEEGAEALPVECRSESASLDAGWLRFLVDACSPPEPGDCGVVALNALFESSDEVWVGIRVGDSDEELSPRQLVGAVPYAVHAATAGEARVARHALTADVATTLEDFDPADVVTVAGDPCAHGEALFFDEEEGAFTCLNVYDKDGDGTLVWDDCDDNDPVLNHENIDGDQSSSCDGDCDDFNPAINPANTELCGSGIDENCDDVVETADFCLSVYHGGGQTVYMMGEETLPAGDAARWYQGICEAAGLRPVSCDPDRWSPGYDASDFNAVVLNAEHYGCNVSSGVSGLTGWEDILTFHQPYGDAQGVCQNGCTIDGDPVFPICTP